MLECEHCGFEIEMGGYDDENYYNIILPSMDCQMCFKKSPSGAKELEECL